jgi:hypothetical protein
MRPSKYALRLAMLVAAITVAACGDSTSPRTADLTGIWTLRSIDGVSVDAPPSTNEDTYIRVHEQLTIQAGGTYQDFVHDDYIDVATGALLDSASVTLTGTWTFDGTTLHLRHDAIEELGGLIGDTLRVGTSAFTR